MLIEENFAFTSPLWRHKKCNGVRRALSSAFCSSLCDINSGQAGVHKKSDTAFVFATRNKNGVNLRQMESPSFLMVTVLRHNL